MKQIVINVADVPEDVSSSIEARIKEAATNAVKAVMAQVEKERGGVTVNARDRGGVKVDEYKLPKAD